MLLLTVITQWMINTRFLILYYPNKNKSQHYFYEHGIQKFKERKRNGVHD